MQSWRVKGGGGNVVGGVVGGDWMQLPQPSLSESAKTSSAAQEDPSVSPVCASLAAAAAAEVSITFTLSGTVVAGSADPLLEPQPTKTATAIVVPSKRITLFIDSNPLLVREFESIYVHGSCKVSLLYGRIAR